MKGDKQLTVKQRATNYWVVERGAEEIAGALTRHAAESERELVRRLRRRTAQMRRATPRRARVDGRSRP